LVAEPPPLGLTSHGIEDLRIDPDSDQSAGGGPEGWPPDTLHRAELRGGSFRDVGEVNRGTSHEPPALCDSLGAR
jgi:hypothetical protein